MGGVDIANQYRAAFTTLQHQNYRYWKPLFSWLLDLVLVNIYLLAKASGLVIGRRRQHRQFQEALAKALMAYHETPEHNQIRRPTRAYCAYCQKHQSDWQPKYQRQRSFGTNITNISSRGDYGGRFRGSSTQWGCDLCNIPLCKIGDCWRLWHEKFN
jgi:hypothetical protein